MHKLFYKHIYLILVNMYLLFTYFLIFPFFTNQEIKSEYLNEKIIKFSYESIFVFILFFLFLNIFYFYTVRFKFLDRYINRLLEVKLNVNYFLFFFITIYFSYYFLKLFLGGFNVYYVYFLSPNILVFIIVNLFYYKALTEKVFLKKLFYLVLLFFYLIFLNYFVSINSKAIFVLSLSFTTFCFFKINIIKIFSFLVIILLSIIIFLSFENHNRFLNQQYMKDVGLENSYPSDEDQFSFYQRVLVRLSQFHILNNIVYNTKSCNNSGYKEISDNVKDYMWSQEYSNPYNTDILYKIVINDINFIHRNLVNDEGIPHYYFSNYFNSVCDSRDCRDHIVDSYFYQNCIKQDFLKGKYYSSQLVDFFPGYFHKYFNNHYKNTFGNYFGRNYRLLSYDDDVTGVGQNLFGSLFLNFGYFGIIFLLIVATFIKIYNNLSINKSVYLPIISTFFAISMTTIENSFMSFFTLNIKLILFIFLIYLSELLINLIKKEN